MKKAKIKEETRLLWEFTVDLAFVLCDFFEQDKDYENVRLLFQNGQIDIGNNFKNQKESLYPISSPTNLKSLRINANNPKDKENPLQTQVVLHFEPELENTICVIWKTDEQFNISLKDNLDIEKLAQKVFEKIKNN